MLSCLFLGLLCDLLWSDPDKEVSGWGENDRGVSFTFGSDVVVKFLNRHDLDLICRAHQVSKLESYLACFQVSCVICYGLTLIKRWLDGVRTTGGSHLHSDQRLLQDSSTDMI